MFSNFSVYQYEAVGTVHGINIATWSGVSVTIETCRGNRKAEYVHTMRHVVVPQASPGFP